MLVLDAARCNLIDYPIRYYQMNHRPESSYIENVWAQAFQTIQRINYITTHLENNTETYSKPYYHILRVLRAMLYLDMIKHWGDLPFFTKHSSNLQKYIYTTKLFRNIASTQQNI